MMTMPSSTLRPEALVISTAAAAEDDEEDEPHRPNSIQSPVPLSREEEASAEVRALAAALAPTLVAADELLQGAMDMKSIDGSKTRHSERDDYYDDNRTDDDDLDDEVEALGASEALLRQELDLAQDFSKLFAFSVIDTPPRREFEEPAPTLNELEPVTPLHTNSTPVVESVDDDNVNDEVDIVIPVDEKLQPIPITDQPLLSNPTTPDCRRGGPDDSFFALASPYSSRKTPTIHYTPREHCEGLGLRREEHGGWYSLGLIKDLLGTPVGVGGEPNEAATKRTYYDEHESAKEYCLAMHDAKLRQLYVGLPEPRSPPVIDDSTPAALAAASATRPSKRTPPASLSTLLPLPVRTVTIRVRPDVLCGAVMEAVHHALVGINAKVTKRQGGHIQALVRQSYFARTATVAGEPDDEDAQSLPLHEQQQQQQQHTMYAPYSIDARLVTYKSDQCERVLLLRIYHVSSAIIAGDENEEFELASDSQPSPNDLVTSEQDDSLDHPVPSTAALHLREAAALIQRMEAPQSAKRINPRFDARNMTRQLCSETVSTHLVEHYRACPSVKDGGITLPALNAEDYKVIQSSWRVMQAVFEELDTRDLAFTTLRSARFGAFPSLPTLDVHYCAQIRRISREAMTGQVVKTAFGLEQYAREAELACANLITLLKPTFETYGVDAPPLPKPKQLTEYPLDYIVPQVSCPPWGDKVQHALNEIQAWTGDANASDPMSSFGMEQPIDEQKSLDLASSAVHLVLEAFRKQDDEEQSARLGRKNVQVMDRLAKMQIHQKTSIQTLQNCTNVSEKAVLAANDFHSKTGVREVPLLKWSISAGRSTGTCTVTANHILFSTQLIPVLGGISKTLYKLEDVDFAASTDSAVNAATSSASAAIRVLEQGREVYTFRPSTGSSRLKSFLDVVKTAQVQVPLDIPDPDVPVPIE